MKAENFQLKSENSEMLNKFSHETTELLKVKEQLSADLLDVSSLYQQLNQERNLLKDQWKELRSDFNNFQNEHESFNELVDSLRLELDSIKQGNESLKLVNLEISTELQTVRDSMTLTTISHEEELRKLDTLNKTLETTVETYEETILEINQQNSCLVKELENKKIDESKLTKQLIKTKEKLDEYNCELHKVKEDLLMKDAELIDIKIKNSDLMSVSAQLETVSNELEDAKIQLEDTDDLFIKLNSTTAQLEVANEKIKQLEKKQEEMNKDADIARNAMSIELAQLRARLQQSNFEKEDFSRKLSQSTLAIQELSSKKEEVQMEEENSNTVGNEVIVEVEIDLEKEEISAHKGPKVSTSLDNPARLLSPAAPVSNRDQASSKASETEIDRDSCSDVPLPAFVSNPLASSFSVAPKNFQFSFSPPRKPSFLTLIS